MNVDEQVTEHNANRKPGEDFGAKCQQCKGFFTYAPGRKKPRCFSCGMARMSDSFRVSIAMRGYWDPEYRDQWEEFVRSEMAEIQKRDTERADAVGQ